MGEDLRVDPLEVRMAADHVDVAAEGLRTAHGSALERMGTAEAGWIGSSATALAATATKWEQDSAAHYTELVGHVEGFRQRRRITCTTLKKPPRSTREIKSGLLGA